MNSRSSGNHAIAVIASLCSVTLAQGGFAHSQDILGAPADTTTPSPAPPADPIQLLPANHVILQQQARFSVGNQYYLDSVAGLRTYLETIRPTNGPLYAQLAPDVERLEAKRSAAYAAMLTGAVNTLLAA